MFTRSSVSRKRGLSQAIASDVLEAEERAMKRVRHTDTETDPSNTASLPAGLLPSLNILSSKRSPDADFAINHDGVDTSSETIVPNMNRKMSFHPPINPKVVDRASPTAADGNAMSDFSGENDQSIPQARHLHRNNSASSVTTTFRSQGHSNIPSGEDEFVFDRSAGQQQMITEFTRTAARVQTSIKAKLNHDRHRSSPESLYGDLVFMLTGLVIIPLHTSKLYQMESDHPKRTAAICVSMAMIFGPLMCLPAVLMKSFWFSRLAFMGGLVYTTLVNILEWPYAEECTSAAMFQSGVLMAVMANISLSFLEKIIRLAISFALASYVSIQSPHSVYFEDTFPILGATILSAIFVLYIYHFGVNRTLATVQGARLILASLFVHHAAVTLTSPDKSAYENIASFVKAVLVVSVGIVATGTFQNEILQKESLEIQVRNRTQNLHMVNMALQASETAIAITDKQGCIIWLNAAFERLAGESEEKLRGLILNDVIHKLDSTRNENQSLLIESYDDPSKRSERDLQIGESIYQLDATPFLSEGFSKDNAATNDRFLMVFKNITAGRAREVAEKKAQDEAMMAKAMGESMLTLTHELRTPLQGIMGVTSSLLQQASGLSNDALESLKLIMASSSLLLNLINNLLDVKKANAKMMEEFPLSSMAASGPIKDAVCFCLPLASISSVHLKTDLAAKNAIVKSNALRLQQVLINLVSNAIKYTKRGSDIVIKIHATTLGDVRGMVDSAIASCRNNDDLGDDNNSSVLVFSVSDRGPGIAPDQADRLFRRYARLDQKPTRTLGSNNVGQPSGTGLGLHLCKLFVERMNGRIWATNNPEDVGGTTFSFYLPLVSYAAHDSTEDLKVASGSRVSDGHSKSSGKKGKVGKKKDNGCVFDLRVLLVDDTLINRKVLSRMLKKIGICNLVTVESGKHALEELSKNPYDLVVTDLQMPGMDGTELSAIIRDTYKDSATPIVVGLTADTSTNVAERCSKSGMSDVLHKPITSSEMKDYLETTVPSLKRGVWRNTATTAYDGAHDGPGGPGNTSKSSLKAPIQIH